MKTDREEIEELRLSIIRIAQAMRIDNPLCAKDGKELDRVRNIQRGWNDLAASTTNKCVGAMLVIDSIQGKKGE